MALSSTAGTAGEGRLRTRSEVAKGRAWAVAVAGLALGTAAGLTAVLLLATTAFGFHALTVQSDSMAPALEPGDIIVVRPAAPSQVEPGDIVLFENGGDAVPTVHRVVGRNEIELAVVDRETGTRSVTTEYRLITQGDNNPAPDPGDVGADRLLGEVWFTVPAAGALLDRPLRGVFVALLLVTLACWAAYEAWRLSNRRNHA